MHQQTALQRPLFAQNMDTASAVPIRYLCLVTTAQIPGYPSTLVQGQGPDQNPTHTICALTNTSRLVEQLVVQEWELVEVAVAPMTKDPAAGARHLQKQLS